jgi:hypothetical protein
MQLEGSRRSERAWACSEAGFSSQNDDCALGVYYRRAPFCCALFVHTGTQWEGYSQSNAPCSQLGREILSKTFRKSQMMADQVRKWLRQQLKRLLCYGFRRTGKAMGHVYQCWWRICRDINVSFQVQISHVLRFISISDLFTDSSSYKVEYWEEYCAYISKITCSAIKKWRNPWWQQRWRFALL